MTRLNGLRGRPAAFCWIAGALLLCPLPAATSGETAPPAAAKDAAATAPRQDSSAGSTLRERLASTDAKVRLQAITEIGRGGPESLPLLAAAFSDPDENVRALAVDHYARIAGPASLPILEPLIQDPSTAVIHDLLKVFHDWGTHESIAVFLKILKDGPAAIRPYAISLLEGVEDPQIVPVVMDLARSDPTPNVRRGAFYVLRYMKAPAAAELARTVLAGEPETLVQEAAVQYLAALGCDVARPALVPLLADKDLPLREITASTLARNCGPSVAPSLLEMLRWKGEPGKPPAPSENLKVIALQLLVRNPLPDARPEILRLLADPAPHVRRYAVSALASMGGDELTKALAPLAQDQDPLVRGAVMDSLGRLPPGEGSAPLLAALSDPALDVRLTALRSLGALKDRRAVAAILKMMEEKDPAVRAQAALTLGMIGDPAAAPALIKAAGESNALVKENAAEALGELQSKAGVEVLKKLSADGDVSIRLAAVRSLGKIGDPRARSTIDAALKDADAQVRAAAREALKNLPAPASKGNNS